MPTQPSELPYLTEEINKKLVGATIVGSLIDPEGESFGFKVEKEGEVLDVWIDRDAEGNGPGWIAIDKG